MSDVISATSTLLDQFYRAHPTIFVILQMSCYFIIIFLISYALSSCGIRLKARRDHYDSHTITAKLHRARRISLIIAGCVVAGLLIIAFVFAFLLGYILQ